ncbi:HVA22-like protein [Populus alba x Populus x berolinensis]|nr:HVA22-like protein [Populus alba x Populus x berolinensis]
MLLYPAYASIQAIERPSHRDNKQWLSYWILYSFISLFEITFLVSIVGTHQASGSFVASSTCFQWGNFCL